MIATIPSDNPENEKDFEKLRYSIRSADGAGFVFFNNYVRHFDMVNHQNVSLVINTGSEQLGIPFKGGMAIKNKAYGVLPFNLDLDGVLLKYVTANPAGIIHQSDENIYTFYAIDGMIPEFCFDPKSIKKSTITNGQIVKEGNVLLTKNLVPGKNCSIQIITKQGKKITLLILTKEEALHSYIFNMNGKSTLLITDKLAFYNQVEDKLTIRSFDSSFKVFAYPALRNQNNMIKREGKVGIFNQYQINVKPFTPPNVTFKDVSYHKGF